MGVAAGPWHIDDTLTFTVVTHRVDTGALTDADAVPAYRIYEDETGTAILTGNTAKLDDAGTTGFYSEQITLSAANGFENGKSYSIYVSAAVNSITGGQTFNFKVDVPDVNVTAMAAGVLTAAAIASDAITDAKVASDVTIASVTGAVGSVTGAVGSVTGNVTGSVGSVVGAVGSVTGLTAADVGAIKAKTDSLTYTVAGMVDVNVLDWKSATAPAMTGDAFARLGAPAGASVSADVAAVKSDTAAVKTKTDSLTFTVAGKVDANIQAVNDVTVTGTGTTADPWYS